MKAGEGQKIVCKCVTVAGYFCNEVSDNQGITGNDIVMDNIRKEIDWGYKCENCGEFVAKVNNGRWSVQVGRGWIE